MSKTVEHRFGENLVYDPATGCIEWTGPTNGEGYSRFAVDGVVVPGHRWAYEQMVGPIPAGLVVDHLCRNPSCQTVEHMEVVTVLENTMRGVGPTAVNARKTHCNYGHPYSGYNLIVRHDANADRDYRRCRTCANKSRREALRRATKRVKPKRVMPRRNVEQAISLPSENATKTHCHQGHEFTQENTYERPGRKRRICRICKRESKRRERQRA